MKRLIAILAGLGTVHILARTATYGAAVNADTTLHLSTALNFLAGEGWRDFTGVQAVEWPPGFTLLLAFGGLLGIEPWAAGRLLNAAAFGLTIHAAGNYLHSNLRSRGLALAASMAIAASLPLTYFASYCITEPLFVLFALLALVQLATFLQRGERRPLLWAAVFTALAALTRYPGVVLLGTGVLLLVRRPLPLAARLKDAVVFGAVSSLPLAGVLTHNWAVSGTLTGRRDGSGQSLSEGLSQVAEVFREWVVPPNAPDGLAYLLWLAVGLVGLAGAVVVRRATRMRQPPPSFRLEPALPFGAFALMYLVFIIAIVPFTVGYGIDSRYLLPVYMPLLLVAAFLLDRFLSIETTGWMAAAKWGLASLVLLGGLVHIGYSAHRNLTITDQARVAGFEDWTYNGSYWESSETLKYIRDTRMDGRMYSNNAYLAWFADRTAAPGKHQHLPDEIHRLTAAILEWSADDSPYIAWLRREKSFYAYDEFDLRCLPGVEPVAELDDGVVFRVTAAEPFDADRHRARKQRYVQQLVEQASERVGRAGWDVYRTGRKLIYRKQPCASADVQAKLVLHVIPVDPADLPTDRKQYGYDSLGFYFDQRESFWLGDQCVAITQLPAYPIGLIRVGQWISVEDRTLWAAELSGAED